MIESDSLLNGIGLFRHVATYFRQPKILSYRYSFHTKRWTVSFQVQHDYMPLKRKLICCSSTEPSSGIDFVLIDRPKFFACKNSPNSRDVFGVELKRDSASPIPRVPDFPGLGLTFENEAGTRGIGTHFRKLAGIAGLRKWKNESRKTSLLSSLYFTSGRIQIIKQDRNTIIP